MSTRKEWTDTGIAWSDWARLRLAIMAADHGRLGGDGFRETALVPFDLADSAGLVGDAIDAALRRTGASDALRAFAMQIMSNLAAVVQNSAGVLAAQWGGVGDLKRQGIALLLADGDATVQWRGDKEGHWLKAAALVHAGNKLWREMLCHKLGCGPVDRVGQPGILWPYRFDGR